MSNYRNETLENLVEYSVKNNSQEKMMKEHINKICDINDWERISEREIFDICKKLSFEYLQKSFNMVKNSTHNFEFSKKLNSYARRFPNLEQEFINKNVNA